MAIMNVTSGELLNNINDNIVPINGAMLKKALVLAQPIFLIASTNRIVLKP